MLCSSGRALVYKKKYKKISYNAELVADPEAGEAVADFIYK